MLTPPARVSGADYLIVESTYGNRTHSHSDVLNEVAQVINRTSARGGVLLIPAFAVGRTQTLLHCIHLLKQQGTISHGLPVYLNSPMAAQSTQVFQPHPEELRLTARECEAMTRNVHIVQTPDESRRLNTRHGPMIIVAASGMATGGRVVHHLKASAPDGRNTILFAGFQAGDTRGATFVSGAPTVSIHGEDILVRAEVAVLDSLSTHADAVEIIDWLRGFTSAPRKTFITHGEPAAADAMRQRIERELHWSCHVPYYLESVQLDGA